jgi:hypothetical protein
VPEEATTIVAILLQPDAMPTPPLTRRLALMLTAVRAGGRWRPIDDHEDLARARALDVPVSLIFYDEETTG